MIQLTELSLSVFGHFKLELGLIEILNRLGLWVVSALLFTRMETLEVIHTRVAAEVQELRQAPA